MKTEIRIPLQDNPNSKAHIDFEDNSIMFSTNNIHDRVQYLTFKDIENIYNAIKENQNG